MTATLYSSTDTGAPQFVDNDPASNLAIIKAVLIDGYGSRTPTGGWTLPFEDVPGGIACFQSPVVGAPILQLKVGTNEQSLDARGFATMSSATVGTGEFPSQLQEASYSVPMRDSTSLNGSQFNWWMIVDDDGEYFYFLQNNETGFGYAKLNFSEPSEARWILAGVSGNVSTGNDDRALFSVSVTGWYCNIAAIGGVDGESCDRNVLTFTAMTQPSTLNSKLYFTRPAAVTITTNQFLGFMPGWVLLDGVSSNNVLRGQKFIEAGGQKYLAMQPSAATHIFPYDN